MAFFADETHRSCHFFSVMLFFSNEARYDLMVLIMFLIYMLVIVHTEFFLLVNQNYSAGSLWSMDELGTETVMTHATSQVAFQLRLTTCGQCHHNYLLVLGAG